MNFSLARVSPAINKKIGKKKKYRGEKTVIIKSQHGEYDYLQAAVLSRATAVKSQCPVRRVKRSNAWNAVSR